MLPLYGNAEVDSCYVALPEGVMLLVDDHPSSKFDEAGSLIPIEIRDREWYSAVVETGKMYFTDITQNIFTGEVLRVIML